MSTTTNPETEYDYELVVTADSDEEAVVNFHESFDDENNYTEPYHIQQYDSETFGVFFLAEKEIDTDEIPMVLELTE